MYIKQVIIQGFRSYRDQTVVEPFSPNHNVVVGRNGSGKSNFFYAIQFVLSDEFSHLREEQRQALLHEGTGMRVLSAYVEIIFDNSDNRIPIDKDEVIVRRVIGAKKDQYYLDRKMVSKTDIMNLLESAGFSRSNPYYIVKQGKINQMATAPDSHRLKLLREVAGTKVYDERKEESKVILQETEGKIAKIEDLLRYIQERLSTLESEKEELKEYQKWDRMRRALEYTIHDHELRDTRRKLDEIQEKREQGGQEAQVLREKLQEAEDKCTSYSRELRTVRSQLTGLTDELDQLQTEQQEAVTTRSKHELNVKDLQDQLEGDSSRKGKLESQLEKVEREIGQTKEKLEKIKPEYEEQNKLEEKVAHELEVSEQRRKELYAKQGRQNQFTTREERDGWIKKELKSFDRAIRDKENSIRRLTEDLEAESKQSTELTTQIEEVDGKLSMQKEVIDQNNKSLYEMKKKKEGLQNERNVLWRQENSLQQSLGSLREELNKREQALRSLTGKALLNGMDSVHAVLQNFREQGRYKDVVDGYMGTLIENFECEKTFFTCVEVTAGSRLFHHVVKDDHVGTRILEEMNRLKLPGEVTFMPINRLQVMPTNYPDRSDAIPMISKLQYDQRYDKVLQHVFGKTLICRDMEVATEIARNMGLDCITLDGDQVSRRGALTGGYYDTRKSRLELQKGKLHAERELKDKEKEYDGLKQTISVTESDITKIVSEMQRMETKNSKNKDTYEKMKSDLRLMKQRMTGIETNRKPKERSLQSLRSGLEAMQGSAESLREELGSDLMAQLSMEDQAEMDGLNDTIQRLTQQNKDVLKERTKLERQKNQLEATLNNNLSRKLERIKKDLTDITSEDLGERLKAIQEELEEFDKRNAVSRERIKELENEVETLSSKQRDAQHGLDKWKGKERDISDEIGKDSKNLDKMTNKQSLLLKKKDECMRKIRELGSLPSDAFDKYQGFTAKQLYKKLEDANKELKRYAHVNKKALDQFVQFSEQREKLTNRKEELDRGNQSIVELIDALDHRKYEAIQITFKQVSKYFSEIFKKLVPSGHGVLVMRKGDTEQTSQDHEDGAVPLVEQFTGVGIKVSFTGNQAEMRDMQQLSGGQKSLVALTLIFAIQKCDPAPFYLFDEIDAALDSQHRKAVADMIHELCRDAQFITTTFRPELLEHASKYYGVLFRNKVSHVDCVSKDAAQDFVEDDTTHG